MIRATTVTHKFTLPLEFSTQVKKLRVIYSQLNKNILVKTEKDVTSDWKTIYVPLTQEETKCFAPIETKVQIRVLTVNDEALATKEYTFIVEDILDDEVL